MAKVSSCGFQIAVGFTKLDENLDGSSIFREADDVFKVWMLILSKARRDGVAPISAVFISSITGKSDDDVERCLVVLESPDPRSRSKNDEGRRISRIDGGFFVINHAKYRERALSQSPDAIRKRKARGSSTSEMFADTSGHSRTRPDILDVSASVQRTAPTNPWVAQACDAWTSAYDGNAPGGQIGRALLSLVKKHGWDVLRLAWLRYLSETDAKYASPTRFAQTYGRWSGTVVSKAAVIVDDGRPKAETVIERISRQNRELEERTK